MAQIGGMLAQTGANIGTQLGQAGQQFGRDIGGMLSRVGAGMRERRNEREIQEFLRANQNDVAALEAKAQELLIRRDPMAPIVQQAAQAAKARRQTRTAALEQGGADITKEAQQKRAMQVAMQDNDERALVALRAGALDPVEYLKSRATAEKPKPGDRFKVVGNNIYDTEEQRFITPPDGGPKEKDEPIKIQTVGDQLFVFEGTDLVRTIDAEQDKDSEEEAGARSYVINSTTQTLNTVREAKRLLDTSYAGVDPGGISGSITAMIPGSPAHELMTSTYVTIAGREALDEINRMKQEAAKYGSRGTGLGQVTQIEFAALQGNLAKLNTGLTVQRQKELLQKIEDKLTAARRIASGENPIDVIDFNDEAYIEAGYIKEGGEVYYFAPDGKEFIYDRNKEAFVPYAGD